MPFADTAGLMCFSVPLEHAAQSIVSFFTANTRSHLVAPTCCRPARCGCDQVRSCFCEGKHRPCCTGRHLMWLTLRNCKIAPGRTRCCPGDTQSYAQFILYLQKNGWLCQFSLPKRRTHLVAPTSCRPVRCGCDQVRPCYESCHH